MKRNEKIEFLRKEGVDVRSVDHNPEAQRWGVTWADGAYEEELPLDEALSIAIETIERNQRAIPLEIYAC